MDSLPYVDLLFKEYLLFRGFTSTLQAFITDLEADRCCGFQAEALCELIFGQLLPQCRTAALMQLLDLLGDRLFSRLDGRFEGAVERMQVALIKAALVCCVKSGRQDKVAEFFRSHGDALLSGPEAGLWRQWAALAFVPSPRKDPAFQAYFSQEWMNLVEVSFRNLLSQVLSCLPLPAVLRFNADRHLRRALQQQVDSLQRQVEDLVRQLAAARSAGNDMEEQLQQQEGKEQRHEEKEQQQEAAAAAAAAVPASSALTASESRGLESDAAAAPAAGVFPPAAQATEADLPPPLSPPPPPPPPAASTAAVKAAAAAAAAAEEVGQPREQRGERQQQQQQSKPQLPVTTYPQQSRNQRHHQHHRTLSLEAWHAFHAHDEQGVQAETGPPPPEGRQAESGVASAEDAAQGIAAEEDAAAATDDVDEEVAGTEAHAADVLGIVDQGLGLGSGEEECSGSSSSDEMGGRGSESVDNGQEEEEEEEQQQGTAGEDVGISVGIGAGGSTAHSWDLTSAMTSSSQPPTSSSSIAVAAAAPAAPTSATATAVLHPPGSLHGAGHAVLATQFSPGGGQNVATAAADGSVAIWSVGGGGGGGGGGGREAQLTCGSPATCVAWDARADKVMLVGTASRGILAWHADTRRVAAEIPPDPAVPWVTQLACSRHHPVFFVASASTSISPAAAARLPASAAAAASPESRTAAAATMMASPPPTWLSSPPRVTLASSPPSLSPISQRPPSPIFHASSGGGSGGGRGSSGSGSPHTSYGGGSGATGRLSVWNMRAFKRVASYTVPQDVPVLSLSVNPQGSWFAAGTSTGAVHLYDSNPGGARPAPFSTFRAGQSASSAAAPVAVQVYDGASGSSGSGMGSETLLATCCDAVVRLWSVRRLAEPLLSVQLPFRTAPPSLLAPSASLHLYDIPGDDVIGGTVGCGSSFSTTSGGSSSSSHVPYSYVPSLSVSAGGEAAAVVLGGGGPQVYVVQLTEQQQEQQQQQQEWHGVSVLMPYTGDGGGSGGELPTCSGEEGGSGQAGEGGAGEEEGVRHADVYGSSCCWHPSRNQVVVGYSDGAVAEVGLGSRWNASAVS